VSDPSSPPRENLIRADSTSTEWRDVSDGPPVLFGYFSRFGQWTEIDSYFEGRFLERIAGGSYSKTFSEQRDKLRVLFQHGKDPMVGDKPIAVPDVLEERDAGAYHESPLLDGVPELIVSGIRAKQYGQSFRMEVMREDINQQPGKSDYNPNALPERTITEIRLHEFGPVTFPAYANTEVGLRSLTDRFIFDWLERNPTSARSLVGTHELREAAFAATSQENAPSTTDAATSTSEPERRVTASTRGLLALPTRTPRTGFNLRSKEQATWPFR
jgi:HK97 family phage prohead protease